jgi:tetratricopeptide (TPR) repeat protein
VPAVYESFIAAINAKMDEFDDDGDIGMLISSLYIGWINARVASGAPARETAARLAWWIEHDDYGLASEIEDVDVIKSLDPAGLHAFADVARAKIGEADGTPERDASIKRRTWEAILRAIFIAQRDVQRFIAAAEKNGLTPALCETIAEMLESAGKLDEALSWTEKGLALEAQKPSLATFGRGLSGLQRRLLGALRRTDDALASAWSAFECHPSQYTYDALMPLVPVGEHDKWRARAMAATEPFDLWLVGPLLVKCDDIERLARRVRALSSVELERLGSFSAGPIADVLSRHHADLAARIYSAVALRIVNRGRSRRYEEALENLAKARDSFLAAGLAPEWHKLVAELRANHSRKTGFIGGFERVVSVGKVAKAPRFLERARKKHAPPNE